MVFIIIGVLVLIYFALPVWLQAIIFIINFFVPDPIPIIDEALMIIGILNKLKLFGDFFDMLLGLLFIGGLIAFIIFFVIPNIGALFAF